MTGKRGTCFDLLNMPKLYLTTLIAITIVSTHDSLVVFIFLRSGHHRGIKVRTDACPVVGIQLTFVVNFRFGCP